MKSSTKYVILCTISFWLLLADAQKPSEKEIAESRAAFKQTMEVLNFVVTSDLVQGVAGKFKDLAPFLGPIGNILGGILFTMGTQEKTKKANFEEVQSKLDDLKKKMGVLSSKVTKVQTSMEKGLEAATADLKAFELLENLEALVRKIKVQRSDLDRILRASKWLEHASDERQTKNHTEDNTMTISPLGLDRNKLLTLLGSAAEDITVAPVASLLVQTLEDDPFSIRPSFYEELINHGKKNPQSRWSITTMIYMIHMRVTMYAFQEIAIAEFQTVMYGNISGTDYSAAFRELESIRKNLKKNLARHARSASMQLRPEHCVESPVFGILTAERVVKLRNFLQVIWEQESTLGSDDPDCKKECSDYSGTEFKKNGCFGTIHSCFSTMRDTILRLDYQDPQVDKVYTGISHEYAAFFSWERVHYKNDYFSDGRRSLRDVRYTEHWCHVCECVCDQKDSPHTMRRFYSVPILAKKPQHVVTGVRFVEHRGGIFLQIQTGLLKPLGMIDQSTVAWQDLPERTGDADFVAMERDHPSLLLNNIYPIDEESVVTGFAFKSFLGLRLRVYKRKIIHWSTGELGPENEQRASYVKGIGALDDGALRKIEGLNPGKTSHSDFEKFEAQRYKFGFSGDRDLWQSCLPYFDGSKIAFQRSVPLSHVSFIRYTNDDEYAGYIRPVLRSLNYNHWYFKDPINNDQ